MRGLIAGLMTCLIAAAACADDDAVTHTDYMLRCQGCHLPDGSGYPGKVPDLRQTLPRFLSSSEGRAFVLRVPGASLSILDDARLARVYNWMVREFVPGDLSAGFQPFTAQEVGPLRRQPLADVQSMRTPIARSVGLPAEY
jgi:hypothetical protein